MLPMVLNVPGAIPGHTYQQRTPQPDRDENCNNEFRFGKKRSNNGQLTLMMAMV